MQPTHEEVWNVAEEYAVQEIWPFFTQFAAENATNTGNLLTTVANLTAATDERLTEQLNISDRLSARLTADEAAAARMQDQFQRNVPTGEPATEEALRNIYGMQAELDARVLTMETFYFTRLTRSLCCCYFSTTPLLRLGYHTPQGGRPPGGVPQAQAPYQLLRQL